VLLGLAALGFVAAAGVALTVARASP